MNRLFLVGWMLISLAGCAATGSLAEREKIYGKESPVPLQSFASRQIHLGETWRIYINASDADGDMKSLVCTVEQPGVGGYPVSRVKIPEGMEKELSGFLFLTTSSVQGLNYSSIVLTLEIWDKAGHRSAPVSFPLSFNPYQKQAPPPANTFQEKALGPIMIDLMPSSNKGGGE